MLAAHSRALMTIAQNKDLPMENAFNAAAGAEWSSCDNNYNYYLSLVLALPDERGAELYKMAIRDGQPHK